MASKDLVTIDGTMTSTDVVKYFANPGSFEFSWSEDPEEISARIDAQTLAATDADSLFGQEEVLKGKNNIGVAFLFQSVEWRPSDIDGEGLPFYGLFHVVTAGGEKHLLSCGAKNVVLKAAKAAELGLFPCWLKLVEVKVKNPKSGFSPPLDLVTATDPTDPDAY
jgi:hypothetical protein